MDEQFRERLVFVNGVRHRQSLTMKRLVVRGRKRRSWRVVVARRFVVRSPVRSSACGAQFVRRRQSAGVGVGACGCRSTSAEGTRAARIRGADGTQGKSFFIIISFSLGFLRVCVCVRPRPVK